MEKSDVLFIMALLCLVLSYVSDNTLFWQIIALIESIMAIIIFIFEVINDKNK